MRRPARKLRARPPGRQRRPRSIAIPNAALSSTRSVMIPPPCLWRAVSTAERSNSSPSRPCPALHRFFPWAAWTSRKIGSVRSVLVSAARYAFPVSSRRWAMGASSSHICRRTVACSVLRSDSPKYLTARRVSLAQICHCFGLPTLDDAPAPCALLKSFDREIGSSLAALTHGLDRSIDLSVDFFVREDLPFGSLDPCACES